MGLDSVLPTAHFSRQQNSMSISASRHPSSSVSVNGPPTELICLDPAWKGFLERIGIIVSASIFMELPPTYSLAAFAAARLINFAPDASQP